MGCKAKKTPLHGFVGGITVVAALAGFVGGFLLNSTTIVVTAAVLIIGITLVNVLAIFFNPPCGFGQAKR